MAQGLLKKHQVFETDLTVHGGHIKKLTDTGLGLIKQVGERHLSQCVGGNSYGY